MNQDQSNGVDDVKNKWNLFLTTVKPDVNAVTKLTLRVRLLVGTGLKETVDAIKSVKDSGPLLVLENQPWEYVNVALKLLSEGGYGVVKFSTGATTTHPKLSKVALEVDNLSQIKLTMPSLSIEVDMAIAHSLANTSQTLPAGFLNLPKAPALPTAVQPISAPLPDWTSLKYSKPVPVFPVPLREVFKVGQKAKGSTPGSTYYTIALNDRVKIAARIRPGTVSLRAEVGKGALDKEIDALNKSMTSNGGYWSIHLDNGDIPVPRVIGAFLMDLGIDFEEQLTSAKQLVTE